MSELTLGSFRPHLYILFWQQLWCCTTLLVSFGSCGSGFESSRILGFFSSSIFHFLRSFVRNFSRTCKSVEWLLCWVDWGQKDFLVESNTSDVKFLPCLFGPRGWWSWWPEPRWAGPASFPPSQSSPQTSTYPLRTGSWWPWPLPGRASADGARWAQRWCPPAPQNPKALSENKLATWSLHSFQKSPIPFSFYHVFNPAFEHYLFLSPSPFLALPCIKSFDDYNGVFRESIVWYRYSPKELN